MKAFVTGGSGFVGRNLIRELRSRGDSVVALVRSDAAAAQVVALGATPARGDLDAVAAMASGMAGATVVFHVAAKTDAWGTDAAFERVNVTGTANVIAATKAAGVARLVHVSTEAIFADGSPMVQMDETRRRPAHPLPGYPASKMRAELLVERANSDQLAAMIVRPRLVWGAGDSTLLPNVVDAVKSGKFAWIGGGTHLTSTCHVRNAVGGMIAAAERGRGGDVFFLSDGPPVAFKAFMSAMLATQGVTMSNRSVPHAVAVPLSVIGDSLWRAFGIASMPPLPRLVVRLFGAEVTVIDAKARRDLGYENVISREAGLNEMRALARA